MDRQFMKDLLTTCSVSGHEEAIQQKALAFGKTFAHSQQTDPSGNALSILNPDAAHKLLLCGHIDEIGFIVTHIDGNGMIHVTGAGGIRAKQYLACPMQIWHKGSMVSAVAASSRDLLKKEEVTAADLLLDIGANSKEDAMKAVSIGDPVCADVQVLELRNDRFSCRGMDNRTGAFVVLEAAKRAAEKGAKIGVYAATTVGEETTMRGAYYAGARVKPDCCIAVDVTWASDGAGADPYATGEITVGGGPVLCMGSPVNKPLNGVLRETAEKLDMTVQWEVAAGSTGTDGDAVNRTGAGVPMALVSIPLRYMHSSVETGSWKDLEGCIELISEFILVMEQKLDAGFEFSPVTP